jgi:hypothetical protein
MLHRKVEFGSLDENPKATVDTFVGLGGKESIVVIGAVASTLNARVAGVESVVPTMLVARTENVYEPSARGA